MVNRYVSAATTGVVFGIIVGLISSLYFCLPIAFVFMVLAGVVTVFLAVNDINDMRDALISSGICWGISGLLGGIIATLGLS